MSDDIELRLRRWLGRKWPNDQSLDTDIFDAAVEIFRLRSHIRQLRLGIDPYEGNPPKWATTAKYEEPSRAHSKSEYKRLKTQGADVLPPSEKT